MMHTFFDPFLKNGSLHKLAILIIGIALIWSAVALMKKKLIVQIRERDNRYRSRKALNFGGFLVAVILALIIYGSSLEGVSVALGVTGVGIAFALQQEILSVAGWLAILVTRYYKVGDRVQLAGIKGDVIDIGVLRTTLMETGQWVDGDLYNGRIVYVPNNFIFKEPVFNYSNEFPYLWDEIKVPLQFGCDYGKAKNILYSIAKDVTAEHVNNSREAWSEFVSKYMIEDAQLEPLVTLIANDKWVEFTVRYIVNYKKRRVIRDILFSRILEAVEKTNGGIKFASSFVQLLMEPGDRSSNNFS